MLTLTFVIVEAVLATLTNPLKLPPLKTAVPLVNVLTLTFVIVAAVLATLTNPLKLPPLKVAEPSVNVFNNETPLTCNCLEGVVVPIPTYPSLDATNVLYIVVVVISSS